MNNLLWLIPDYIDKSKNSIKIFGFEIYYYAIAITLGMVACVLLAIPLFKKKKIKTDFLLDLMIGIVPCAIICARLWYVLFDINSFDSFLDVINIRDGGLAIYGGVAGGALGIFIVCKIRKKKIVKIFDIGAVMLPLGQAIGRWGNYFNQEVYGAIDPNSYGLPVSVFIQATGKYHYALFLWESMLNVLLFVLLYFFLFKYKGKRSGYSTAFYFIGYGLIRMIMEPMRDTQFNLPLFGIESLGMVWVSVALIILGVAILGVLIYRDMKDCNNDIKLYFRRMFKGKVAEKSTATNDGKSVNVEPTIKANVAENAQKQQNRNVETNDNKNSDNTLKKEE